MSRINDFSNYSNKYNTNQDYSFLFGGAQTPTTSGGFNLNDYASIKNGSYGKLLKAYYARQNADKISATGDSKQKVSLIKNSSEQLKKASDALNCDSLWEKKKIQTKDEKTGEVTETEDYDWKAITKAVNSFAESYNDVIEEVGESDSKNVLRNSVYMTGIMKSNEKLLAKAGIKIGKDNKLEVDEEQLKKTDISTLKTLFSGHNSLASKMSQKASSIGNAAVSGASVYTKDGTYLDTLSSLSSSKVDKEV